MAQTKHYLEEVPANMRHLIEHATQRLREEFSGVFAPETIERFVAESCSQFRHAKVQSFVPLFVERFVAESCSQFRHAKVQSFVPLFVERFARERLRSLAKVEGLVASDNPSVVFLCVHNAGRSQMAAGWLHHSAGERVDVFSGGSDPGSEVNPAAIEAMAEVGIDISNEFPKPWTDEIIRAADVIVTMGCGDACPVYPGKHYEDWELTDPANKSLEEVRSVRDEIKARVERLVAELKVD